MLNVDLETVNIYFNIRRLTQCGIKTKFTSALESDAILIRLMKQDLSEFFSCRASLDNVEALEGQ